MGLYAAQGRLASLQISLLARVFVNAIYFRLPPQGCRFPLLNPSFIIRDCHPELATEKNGIRRSQNRDSITYSTTSHVVRRHRLHHRSRRRGRIAFLYHEPGRWACCPDGRLVCPIHGGIRASSERGPVADGFFRQGLFSRIERSEDVWDAVSELGYGQQVVNLLWALAEETPELKRESCQIDLCASEETHLVPWNR